MKEAIYLFLKNNNQKIHKKVIFILLGIVITTTQSSFAYQKAKILSGWDQVIIDPWPLLSTIRSQIADISSLGVRRFVVAYIVEVQGQGELRYARFDVDTGLKSAPTSTMAQANWVRGATGGPIRQGTCNPDMAPTWNLKTKQQLEYGHPNYVTYFSYEAKVDDVFRVKIMRHSWCGNTFTTTYHDVAIGEKPSIAIGHYEDEKKLLVVYGRNNSLFGRFLDLSGLANGAEFEISTFPNNFKITSTDIIWNSVAQRFFVGFIKFRQSIGCTTNNVKITWQGHVEAPVDRGNCDYQSRGHHTSIAYDNRTYSNPDGIYAWWYEGNPEYDDVDYSTKALRLMDANGNPTSFEADLVQTEITFPVKARREKFIPSEFTFGLIPGSYITVSTVSPSSPGEKRMAGWTFDPDGTTRMIGIVTPINGWQVVALETLETETVFLWRMGDRDSQTHLPWVITVFSHFLPEQYAPPAK